MKRIERIMQAYSAESDKELHDAINKLSESDMQVALFALIKTVNQNQINI